MDHRASVVVAALALHCDAPPSSTSPDSSATGDTAGETAEQRPAASSLSAAGWDRTDPGDVCSVWRQERVWLDEGRFSGDAEVCRSGDNPVGRANALGQLNLIRWMAGLPDAVQTDPMLDQAAQQCAVLAHANDSLSHAPPAGSTCYTDRAAEAAAASLLASAPAVASLDLFMVDEGHEDTLGHRRWLLSNSLGTTGIGTTDTHACVRVVDDSGTGDRTWTAWPPPGPFPLEAFAPSSVRNTSVWETGFSVQSDAHDLSEAEVYMSRNAEPLEVRVWPLAPGFGSRSAVGFAPQATPPLAGDLLRVHVIGGGLDVRYEIPVVGCG